MPRATLSIGVQGGADVRRAFGEIAAASRKANEAMQRDSKKTRDAAYRDQNDETRAALMGAAQRARASERLAAARKRIETKTHSDLVTLIALGVVKEEDAAKAKERIYKRNTNAFLAEEKRKTAEVERETRRRLAAEQRQQAETRRGFQSASGSAVLGAAGAAGGALRSIVSSVVATLEDLHGQRQGARRTRAQQEYTLNGAIAQTGNNLTLGEASGIRGRVFGFAQQHGIDSDQLVGAFGSAQDRFNAFGGGDAAERSSKVDDFLGNALLARRYHQDIGEVTQLSAMLTQNHVTGSANSDIVRTMIAEAFGGSVNIGDSLRQGLAPMLQYTMGQLGRLRPGEDRQERLRTSMVEFYAGQQVEARTGGTVRWSGNRLASVRDALTDDGKNDSLHSRLQSGFRGNAQAQTLINGMFDRGSNGRYTLKNDVRATPFEFMRRISTLFNGDTTRFANLMGPGGGVGGQMFQRPDVLAMRAMLGNDASGHPLIESVRSLSESRLTPEMDTFAKNLTDSETLTQQTKDDEAHLAALTSNTTELARFSDRLESWMTSHPVESTVLGKPGSAALLAAAENPGIVRKLGTAATVAGTAMTAIPGMQIPGLIVQAMAGYLPRLQAAIAEATRTGASQATIAVTPETAAHAAAESRSGSLRGPPGRS